METTFGRRADELIKLAFQILSDVRVLRHEVSIERWRVDLIGSFGDYTIHHFIALHPHPYFNTFEFISSLTYCVLCIA